jgi:predicted CXXCH cytochrome family protein
MTQQASPQSVQGDFSGVALDYFGVPARMERGAGGEYVVRYGGEGFPERRFVVQKTVGSRRYQQYVAAMGDELVRLPVAFDLESRRWFHMNGAFLTQDPAPPVQPDHASASQADYERHLTRWNDNCIFCHNVHPNPGRRGEGFESQVAELGVACEACHGPGEEHSRRNQNPLRRFTLHLGDQADPTIVNPARLSPERAADVCGRCHGQRITDDIEHFLREGDRFVPGEDLALYSAPLWHDTTLRGETGVFAPRFWSDGTPRLTAYEYQGLLQSPCYQRGDLTCTSCHGMHEGDPRGQLREAKRGAAMCTDCHRELQASAAQVKHARHGASPPSCTACHMPPIVYGVLSTHPSHRIEVPDPARAEGHARPDACTLCHTDRTRRWAILERARLFADEPVGPPVGQAQRDAPPEPPWSEVERALFAGDPIERSVAAQALGQRLSSHDEARRARASALLLEALEHDPYPVVRRFAARSLSRLQPHQAQALAAFVPESPLARRSEFARTLARAFDPPLPELPRDTLASLRTQAKAQAIDIGE